MGAESHRGECLAASATSCLHNIRLLPSPIPPPIFRGDGGSGGSRVSSDLRVPRVVSVIQCPHFNSPPALRLLRAPPACPITERRGSSVESGTSRIIMAAPRGVPHPHPSEIIFDLDKFDRSIDPPRERERGWGFQLLRAYRRILFPFLVAKKWQNNFRALIRACLLLLSSRRACADAKDEEEITVGPAGEPRADFLRPGELDYRSLLAASSRPPRGVIDKSPPVFVGQGGGGVTEARERNTTRAWT